MAIVKNARPNLLQRIWRRVVGGAPEKRSVFKGAEPSRFWSEWIARYISPDDEMRFDFAFLRARARDLARNNPLVSQYLALLSANVIGPTGIKLQAQVHTAAGDLYKPVNDAIEAAWLDWTACVTADRRYSLTEFSQQLFRSLATDGEIFIRKIRGFPGNSSRFALQQIDPDLIDHQFHHPGKAGTSMNEVRMGIEVDEWGGPLAYYVWTSYPGMLVPRERVRIPADEILHIFRAQRANQTRGTTWINPAMFSLKMMDGYVETELVAARVGAAKMGFFEQVIDENYMPPSLDNPCEIPEMMDASPGTFQKLEPGLSFKEWNPQHPDAAFGPFMKTCSRWAASGLNCSYNTLANDLEGVNYSSIRAGVLTDRDQYRTDQQLWIRRFLIPIYNEWHDYARLSGALAVTNVKDSEVKRALFIPRGWQWVDPLKDVTASVTAIDRRLSSRTRVLAEEGTDPETIDEQLANEEKLDKEYGLPPLAPFTKPATVATTKSEAEGPPPEEEEVEPSAQTKAAVM